MLEQTAIKLKSSATQGFRKGARTWWWLVKMMIPITLAVALLQWCGAIAVISEWLTPMFSHIGLTGEGVLVFVTGVLASIYASIGVMGTLDMDFRSATILAVMILVAHNLIIESVIQRKAGSSLWGITLLRIVAALVVAYLLNMVLPADFTGSLLIERAGAAAPLTDFMSIESLRQILTNWAVANGRLLPLMFGMIIGLNILQQLLHEFRLIHYLVIPLRPLMRLFGLSDNCAFLWAVLNSLGLAYGGSVMISEVEQGRISAREARDLNRHAAMSHSLLEDTLLYLTIGIGLFWLVVPRLVLTITVVWGGRLIENIKQTYDNKRTDQRACKAPGCVEEASLTSTPSKLN